MHQDIRPIKIGILNLMPLKEETELQLLRSLSNTPLQVDVTFVAVSSHESKNTSMSHLNKFYESFADIKRRYFDGLIITGAPVEQMEYEDVDYWEEICQIFEWTKSHVTSTLHLGGTGGNVLSLRSEKVSPAAEKIRCLRTPCDEPESAAGARF